MFQVRDEDGEILNKPKKAIERYGEILRNGKTLYIYPVVELSNTENKRLSIDLTDIKIEANEDRKQIQSVVLYRSPACTIVPPSIHARSPKARFKQAFHTIISTAATLTLLGYDILIPVENKVIAPSMPQGPPYGPLAQQQMKAVRAPLSTIHKANGLNLVTFDPEHTKGLIIDCVAFLPFSTAAP